MAKQIILFDYFKNFEIGKKNIKFINTKVKSLYSVNGKNISDCSIADNFNFLNEQIHFSKLQSIEKNIFPFLVNFLNDYHKAKYSSRFWKIIIGNWLRKSIRLLYNRYYSLLNSLNEKNEFELLFSKNIQNLTYENSSDLDYLNNNLKWNNNIYLLLLKFIDRENIIINKINDNHNNQKTTHTNSFKNNKFIKKFLIKLLKMLPSRSNKYFICQSYLSLLNESFLNLSLFQLPSFNFYFKQEDTLILNNKTDKNRDHYYKNLNFNKSFSKIEIIIIECLIKTLPGNYLEKFNEIIYLLEISNLPKLPKFIFTSNLYDTNDYFKIWAALKINTGSKYFIGQHGNNYFTHKLTQNTIEEEVSDKFISWGVTKNNCLDAFIFKTLPKSSNVKNTTILLNMEHLRLSFNSSDPWSEYDKYINKYIDFINCLDNSIKQNTTIRLHSASKNSEYDYKIKEFIKNLKNNININIGDDKINKLYVKNKIIIHSYDSTGLLETLAMNKPTLALWHDKINHVIDSQKDRYQLLVEANILHFTNKSISNHLKQIYDNVDSWWYSENTQNKIHEFCKGLVNTSGNKVKDLKNILLNEINK